MLGEEMNEYRHIFVGRPEERAPVHDPSILERTDDWIPDKTQCENDGCRSQCHVS